MSERWALAARARSDLLDIIRYSEANWGGSHAETYLDDLIAAFAMLAEHPAAGRSRLDVGLPLRSHVKREHVIYYREREDGIEIVRVLHGSRDPDASELL